MTCAGPRRAGFLLGDGAGVGKVGQGPAAAPSCVSLPMDLLCLASLCAAEPFCARRGGPSRPSSRR